MAMPPAGRPRPHLLPVPARMLVVRVPGSRRPCCVRRGASSSDSQVHHGLEEFRGGVQVGEPSSMLGMKCECMSTPTRERSAGGRSGARLPKSLPNSPMLSGPCTGSRSSRDRLRFVTWSSHSVLAGPVHGALQALLEGDARPPAQLTLDAGGVDGVAQVVPGAVLHVGDRLFIVPRTRPSFARSITAQEQLHQVDVLPLVVPADVVGRRSPLWKMTSMAAAWSSTHSQSRTLAPCP